MKYYRHVEVVRTCAEYLVTANLTNKMYHLYNCQIRNIVRQICPNFAYFFRQAFSLWETSFSDTLDLPLLSICGHW